MAMPIIPVPQFPNVPNVAGVPALVRSGISGLQAQANILSGGLLFPTAAAPPTWGIFDQDGQPLIVGDSCIAVDVAGDWNIPDYPVEGGTFETYNKVTRPGAVKVTIAKGGKQGDVADFLNTVKDLCGSLDLINAVTPEVTYLSMNAVHFDYRREAKNGAKLIQVDIWLQEVRTSVTTTFTATKDASGADPVAAGTVQTKTVPAAVAQERSLRASGEVAGIPPAPGT